MSAGAVELSIVSPVRDEDPRTLLLLLRRIAEVLGDRGWELILVDDASGPRTAAALASLAAGDRRVRLLRWESVRGQETALVAGLLAARGSQVCMMDCDLENPPEALPLLLAALEDGAELVLGHRRERPGVPRLRRWGSRLFNRLMRWRWQVPLHDWGCGMNAVHARLVHALRPRLLQACDRPLKVEFVHAASRWREVTIPAGPRLYGRSAYSWRSLGWIACRVLTRGTMRRAVHAPGDRRLAAHPVMSR